MKKLLTGLTVIALALVAGGCGSGESGASGEGASTGGAKTPSPSGGADPLADVKWVDGADQPALEFKQPFQLDQVSATRVVKEGEGEKIEAGQRASLNYVLYLGSDGSVVESTYATGQPITYPVAAGPSEGDVLYDAIADRAVGSQVIAAWKASPAGGESAEGESDELVTYLLALTIEALAPTRAQGEPMTLEDPELPTVTLDDSGKPSIEIPEGIDPPAELVAETLIKGDGKVVTETNTVTAQYTGWLWADGTEFDSSWTAGEPRSFSLQGVVDGWRQGLSGQTVGSQVLLVIPPDLGYGADGNEAVPGGSTLIFVVDILEAS
ncbi:MAG: FKBP-type peptidyl-prolyl cis-trans isomerase [Bifidobacteriaceae bacterium]|jgi:peptidylprolyl isomerase|nr:FKBP-type peptidyl-prolyl cis-trans isomerase [Bifidobacteriaceae bacterium]